MPLMRRIVPYGKTSRGVILPKSWLTLIEKEHGKIDAVSMEVNDSLTIRPILKKVEKTKDGVILE